MSNKSIEKLQRIIEQAFEIEYLFLENRETPYVVARSVFNYIIMEEQRLGPSDLAKLQGISHATVIHSAKKFDEYYTYYKEYSEKIAYVISEWASVKEEIEFKPQFIDKKLNKIRWIETVDGMFYCYPTDKFTFKKLRYIKHIDCDKNGVFRIEYHTSVNITAVKNSKPEAVVELYPAGIKQIEYYYDED